MFRPFEENPEKKYRGKYPPQIVTEINFELERLLGVDAFGLVERSNHLALLPRKGTVRLIPRKYKDSNYHQLLKALRDMPKPKQAATVWNKIDREFIEHDAWDLAQLLTDDLWVWFYQEGGVVESDLRHYGKRRE